MFSQGKLGSVAPSSHMRYWGGPRQAPEGYPQPPHPSWNDLALLLAPHLLQWLSQQHPKGNGMQPQAVPHLPPASSVGTSWSTSKVKLHSPCICALLWSGTHSCIPPFSCLHTHTAGYPLGSHMGFQVLDAGAQRSNINMEDSAVTKPSCNTTIDWHQPPRSLVLSSALVQSSVIFSHPTCLHQLDFMPGNLVSHPTASTNQNTQPE